VHVAKGKEYCHGKDKLLVRVSYIG
jgi:hypothetical protein